MKRKAKKIFKNFRIILTLVALLLAIVAIYPNPGREGVAIRSVLINSSAALGGVINPKPTSTPMTREVVTSVNNVPIKDLEGYYDITSSLVPNTTVIIQTNKAVPQDLELGLIVYDAPTTNIRKGLDLQGGTRVLLKPERKLEAEELSLLIDNMKQRLNVYGLSDLIIKEANDLPPPIGSGSQYVLVEIAGATRKEVSDLLAREGKFEAKIGNNTAFTGGDDIKSVCRSPECSGLDPQRACGSNGEAWVCNFAFAVTLSKDAADNMADLTSKLDVITDENNQRYLSQQLLLNLDDAEVDQLSIVADLKGQSETNIQITGSGVGASEQEAAFAALENQKQLQTLLITGSLPVKIDIAKTNAISPLLGEEFIKNALFVGVLSLFAVIVVIFIRYRQLTVSLSMLVTMVSEIIILLGFASLIGWNLDLAAIAGIIIAVGTGVDDQIVITDETLKGESSQVSNWKKRLKRALFIIMAAYFTTVVAMLPLVAAGAGLLKGFAITTIIGVSIGVFITRPAYASLIEILVND